MCVICPKKKAAADRQDVVPYVLSDWLSFLAPSIISPTIYIILVYFMADLRSDHLAADLFILIADVSANANHHSKQ